MLAYNASAIFLKTNWHSMGHVVNIMPVTFTSHNIPISQMGGTGVPSNFLINSYHDEDFNLWSSDQQASLLDQSIFVDFFFFFIGVGRGRRGGGEFHNLCKFANTIKTLTHTINSINCRLILWVWIQSPMSAIILTNEKKNGNVKKIKPLLITKLQQAIVS